MNISFKLNTFFSLLFFLPVIFTHGMPATLNFDKAAFYAAMAGTNVGDVNTMLLRLKESNVPEKTAYEGALLMKKAGLLTKAKVKLSLFKSGRSKLEGAIKEDEGNVEYHFLRLIIQENAPKIVKYKNDLKKDTDLVSSSYKKLAPVVQQAVRNYSKKSTFLKLADA